MIETVLGPIDASALGTASTNEHILTDSRGLLRPTREGGTLDGPIRPGILGDLRWSWMSLADNLTLDDPGSATEELAAAHADGVEAIVEATSWGMGPRHADLPEISRAAGIHIVSAYGSYIDKTLPGWWSAQSEAEMETAFTTALTDAVPGTSFRAGLLGLLGTSAQITAAEGRALRAAGRAAAAAGSAVSIRLDGAARRAPDVIEILTAQGLGADRILFCNIDKVLDAAYVRDVVDAGAVVEFAFGSEHNFADLARDATDVERMQFLCGLLADRPAAAITLSCSVWTKGQLTRHGGMGYGHVVRRVAPALRRLGVSEEHMEWMLVATPALLLDRPPRS
ncbi:phosphotriesterase [Microbacterium rhizomatis]|uniref:Phosphotriesterase n=1 Tax=Microbacterium rhizomatis TaxID=1631477 RepID=A0A5J5J444_9MICO|nr:phosphotriesterase [Microbacterium rhizomatis]KAA9108018.1 phosphotriesterase [Microbacterium rhizomatis]